MSAEKQSQASLDVSCPACSKRFKVKEELMGRMVECGACDSRFRIDDDVLIKQKRFFPGEKGNAELDGFKKVPNAIPITESTPNLDMVRSTPQDLSPTSPLRIFAGFVGIILLLGFISFALFSIGPNNILVAMSFEHKMLVALFISVLGTGLLIFANYRIWIRVGFCGLGLSAAVFAVMVYIDGIDFNKDLTFDDDSPSYAEIAADTQQDLRKRYLPLPLEKEKEAVKNSGSDKHVRGVFVTGLNDGNRYTVRDFFISEAEASPISHIYPRKRGTYLMVISETEISFEQLISICKKLGTVNGAHEDLDIVEVAVSPEHFIEGSEKLLGDRSTSQFYSLNLAELNSINLDRVRKAVKRLSGTRSEVLRIDITDAMIELMKKPGVTFHGPLAKALLEWAKDPKEAAIAALPVLQKYQLKGEKPPTDLVALIAAHGAIDAAPAVAKLWRVNPVIWERDFAKFGAFAEPYLRESLNDEKSSIVWAATKLLADVGTKKSLTQLTQLLKSEDTELRILSETAIQRIKQRAKSEEQ